ncbi:BA14K family protein [Methyloligella solikamskensis]|uniref:Lectin-like protein BA14k n=1 Tax=Methyloligella solikamskensis TaxID=1177756 RepID=A0ABW3J9A7_9HYPH
MKKLSAVLAAALIGITAVSYSVPAAAGDRYHGYNRGDRAYDRGYNRGYRQGKYNHKDDHGDALAAGIIGLGVGAMIGSAAASPPPPPPPAYSYYGPAEYSYGGPPAWSPDWYAYCSSKYRSFNPRTGYFMGYDGRAHFCY